MNQNLYQILVIVAAFSVPVFSIVGVYVSVKIAIAKLQVEIENVKCEINKLTLRIDNFFNIINKEEK